MRFIIISAFFIMVLGFQNCSKQEFEYAKSAQSPNLAGPCAGGNCESGESLSVIAHKELSTLNSEHEFDYYNDELYITVLNAETGLRGCLDIADTPSRACSENPEDWEDFKWEHFSRSGSTLRLVVHNLNAFGSGGFSLYGSMLLEPNRVYRLFFYNPDSGESSSTHIRVNRNLTTFSQ